MTAPALDPATRGPRNGAEQAGDPPRLSASRRNKRRFGADWKMAWAFVVPFLVLFVAFHLVPVFYALWQSFHGVEKSGGLGFDTPSVIWVGLDNYTQALTDPAFLESVGRVLLYGLVQVPVMLGLALMMALIFDTAIVRMRGLFQLAAFLPYAVPGIIASIVWAFLYLPGVSPVVDFFDGIGAHVDFPKNGWRSGRTGCG